MPGFARLKESYDLVVVGGGHAGLQAGLKAGLLHQTAAILDRGPRYSRSFYAPNMVNVPGFPDGVSGHKLLDLQVAALQRVSERVGYFSPARALAARRVGEGFEVDFDWLAQRKIAKGRGLVLALGVVDRLPEVDGKIDPVFPWANFGLLYFCMFCDGHDFAGRKVAVLGHTRYAVLSALDATHFGPTSVELLTMGKPLLEGTPEGDRPALLARLEEKQVGIRTDPIAGWEGIREKLFGVRFSDGTVRTYDRGFSALEWYDMNQAIPRSLGAAFDDDGFVLTDEDCRVLSSTDRQPIPGLYCIGDQRNGWNQIPEAWATAERAVVHAYGYFL